MTNREMRYEMMKHTAAEYSCNADDFLGDTNKVIPADRESDVFFKMHCFGHAAVARADPRIGGWCRDHLSRHIGFRYFDGVAMTQIYEELRKYGYWVGYGQGALPDMTLRPVVPETEMKIRVFERKEIADFFANEIDLQKDWPMIGSSEDSEVAVVGYVKGRVAGISVADRQNDRICDIGYEVDPSFRERGIASVLTLKLTRILLSRDIIPCATLAWSNIASKGVLHLCGYYAAWSTLASSDREWAMKVIEGKAE